MSRLIPLAFALVIALALPAAAAAQEGSRPPAQKPAADAAPVNINTATAAELQKLPGIGAATAARIIEHRQKNGPFKKVEELMNVRGIGEASFLKLKPLVSVAPPRTAPLNR